MPHGIENTRAGPLGWLMRIGLVWSVLAVTGTSIALSLLLTGLHLTLVVSEPVPLEHWVFTAVAVPSMVAPAVATAVLSLAYRLVDAKAALEQAVRTDHLTGIGNRRAFIDVADREMARFDRSGQAFSIVILDIDHFKALNDRHGHAAGDEALMAIATLGTNLLRRSDMFCRWGGEEFIALLPDTVLSDAVKVAEKLRVAVGALHLASGHRLTASLGVATIATGHATLDAIIRDADRQLYRAKAEGRDRTMPPSAGAAASPSTPCARAMAERPSTGRPGMARGSREFDPPSP